VTYIPACGPDDIVPVSRRDGVSQRPLLVNTIVFRVAIWREWGIFEYRIPLRAVSVSCSRMRAPQDRGQERVATGLDGSGEHQFAVSVVNQQSQLQIAPGTNFHPRVSTGIEFNINLPIVQAPFGSTGPTIRCGFTDDWGALRQHHMNNLYLQCRALGLTIH